MVMTQEALVLTCLQEGQRLTPAKAIPLGIMRLAAVVHSLRKQGHPIQSHIKRNVMNRPYAEYFLSDRQRLPA